MAQYRGPDAVPGALDYMSFATALYGESDLWRNGWQPGNKIQVSEKYPSWRQYIDNQSRLISDYYYICILTVIKMMTMDDQVMMAIRWIQGYCVEPIL